MTWETKAAHHLARARWKMAKAASVVALGRTVGHLPETFVRSLVEVMTHKTIRQHVDEVSLLTGAHVEHFAFDPQLGPEYRRSKAFDDRFLYRLTDVCVSPASGLVWLPGGRVLGESYGSLSRVLGWGAVVEETLLPCTKRIRGPIVALPDTGYFHWLLEVLPAAIHWK